MHLGQFFIVESSVSVLRDNFYNLSLDEDRYFATIPKYIRYVNVNLFCFSNKNRHLFVVKMENDLFKLFFIRSYNIRLSDWQEINTGMKGDLNLKSKPSSYQVNFRFLQKKTQSRNGYIDRNKL